VRLLAPQSARRPERDHDQESETRLQNCEKTTPKRCALQADPARGARPARRRLAHLRRFRFPLFDLADRPYGICGISIDLTEIKAAEEQLRHAQKLSNHRRAHPRKRSPCYVAARRADWSRTKKPCASSPPACSSGKVTRCSKRTMA